MSLQIIKSQIFLFLKSDTPEVMAIRGKWGVGKTYLWKQLLVEAQKNQQIALNKYAYVSLFGVNSLEKLKFSIFEQLVDKDLIGKEPSIETFKSNADNLVKSLTRKSIGYLLGFPTVNNFGSAIKSISFLSIQKVLLCIDDFERKGDDLSAKDILGLISVLKEQKNCKIVLILNDKSFDDSTKEDYKLFREKCIDMELVFDPSAKECADITITGQDKKQYQFSKKLKEVIEKIGINNIRIIKKIERLGRLLEEKLSEFDEKLMDKALESLSLFSWCYYTGNDISPDFHYVKNYRYPPLVPGFPVEGKKPSEPEYKIDEKDKEKWKRFLTYFYHSKNKFYYSTDELNFDLQIANIVETGFIDNEKLLPISKEFNKKIIARKSQKALHDAWRIFHNSFDNNKDLLVKLISENVKKIAIEKIAIDEFNNILRLLRYLGENKLTDELIDYYVNIIKDNKENLESIGLFQNSFGIDYKLMDALENILNEYQKKITLKKAVELYDKNKYMMNNTLYVKVMEEASSDEYYKLFKNEKGEKLSSYITTCLGPDYISNDSHRKISENAKKALERIGCENSLNACRVRRFGIKIPEETRAGGRVKTNEKQTWGGTGKALTCPCRARIILPKNCIRCFEFF